MLTYTYNPFSHPIENLDETDLIKLKEIPEGWYIDYKSQPIKTIELAKHLSAFANQHGGWLIFGIDETKDGSRCAGDFCGILDAELPNLSLQLREASSAHINPEILYEEKVFKGPSEILGLPNGKSIFIIGIPRSTNTPHIHSSGRIYRRLADQSKPKEETDRYLLDELWKRGEENKRKFTDFLTKIPNLPESHSKHPWAYIYLVPNQMQGRPSKWLSFDEFKSIVSNSDNQMNGASATMSAVHTTSDGYVARQINGDPAFPAFTFRWWHHGAARFEIPLNLYNLRSFQEKSNNFKNAAEFTKLVSLHNGSVISIVDYSILILALTALSNIYLHILRKLDDRRDVYSCFTLKNVFYTTPFLDSLRYLEMIKEHSLPLTTENEIRQPLSPNQDNMFLHKSTDRDKHIDDPIGTHTIPFIFSAPLAFNILLSVGAIQNQDDYLIDQGELAIDKIYPNKKTS